MSDNLDSFKPRLTGFNSQGFEPVSGQQSFTQSGSQETKFNSQGFKPVSEQQSFTQGGFQKTEPKQALIVQGGFHEAGNNQPSQTGYQPPPNQNASYGTDPFKPVPSGAFGNQPAQSEGGFQDIQQTGFQQTYSVLLSDINTVKQSLLDVQTQLVSAHTIIQKCESDSWYWKGNQDSEYQQHGFHPVDEQKVTFMENDIASLRSNINQASYVLQEATKVVQKDGFGPYQNKGFNPNNSGL